MPFAAADFVQRLSGGGRVVGNGIEVTEPIDLKGAAGFDFKRSLYIENFHFCYDVSLANCSFDGGVTFSNCKFDGSLDLGKAAVGNRILLTKCRFDPAGARPDRLVIILDDARIRGDLVCDRVGTVGCISARRLRVAGSIEFTECTIDAKSLQERAALDLSDAKIKGSVVFESGRWPNGAAEPEQTRPRRSSFHDSRNSEPTSVLLRGADVTDMVKLSWAQFQGEVDLAFIECRSLESEVGIFSRSATEKSIENAGQNSVKPDENVGGASIAGPLTLSGGQFGLIHLHGISISSEMMLIAGQSGQIIIDDGICTAEHNEHFIIPSKLGHFIMSSWRCSGFLHLHAAEVIGESNPSRIRGIVIRSSVIDHSLSLWPGSRLQRSLELYLEAGCKEKEQLKFFVIHPFGFFLPVGCRGLYRNLLNRWRRQMIVRGNVSIDHCSIGDDLLLTGIDLVAESETDDGRIEVVDSKIDGNLVFRSPISFLADAQVDAPLLRLFAQRLVVTNPGSLPKDHIQVAAEKEYLAWRENFIFVPACCHMLDTTGLKAIKIDLTGLCVRRPLKRDIAAGAAALTAGKRDENLPNAIMSNSEVNGKIATFARLSRDVTREIYKKIENYLNEPAAAEQQQIDIHWPRELLVLCFGDQTNDIKPPPTNNMAHAEISGSLDLQHSILSELMISDASFRQHFPHEKAADSGIVLDYAQISKLYVARSQLSHVLTRGHNGFPVPVSLLDFSVKTWFLEDEEKPETFSKIPYADRETMIAGPYLDLLENDPAFRMSSYLAVEKSLRDRGFTEEARQIFIAGTYRDVRTKSGKGPTSESTSWRRGDGRFRKATLPDWALVPLLFLGSLAAGAYFGIDSLAKNYLRSVGGATVALLIIFALRSNVLRLKRGCCEYVRFIVCTAWCAATIYALHKVTVFMAGAFPHDFELLLAAGLAGLLVAGMALSGALRLFIDQLYWSLVDYGTSAWRLAGVILILMAVSFALVSPVNEKFAPTLLAQSIPGTTQKPQLTVSDSPRDWPFGQRLWMTLRYHVPLVGAVISEEWQPADRPLLLAGATICSQGAPSSPRCDYWPTARDWYGFMLWTNWILWPLFLPFLIRTLSRER